MIPGNLYDSGVRVQVDVNPTVHDTKCLRLYLSARLVRNYVSNMFTKRGATQRRLVELTI
jgi:hypothetical protein